MESVEAQEILLSSAVASGEVGQLLVTGAGGALKGAGAGLKFAGDTLTVEKLGAFKAMGPIDFDNQRLSNIAINGGTVSRCWDAVHDLHCIMLTTASCSPFFAIPIAVASGGRFRLDQDSAAHSHYPSPWPGGHVRHGRPAQW
jgi:hypothetical protein